MSSLSRILREPGPLRVAGAPEGFDALAVADAARARGGVTAFVARDEARAASFVEALGFFAPDLEVLRFNNWDCLPYDRMGPTPGVSASRMAALSRLVHRKPNDPPLMVVTSTGALMQRLPPRDQVRSSGFSAKPGEDVDVELLEYYFAANGYQRASTVSDRGEFAIRGGVIDVFPPGAEEPVRLDLFGDTLETLRTFDPLTQRSTGKLDRLDLLPVSEILLDSKAVSRFPHRLHSPFRRLGRGPALRHGQRGRATPGHGALAAALLRPAGDPVRLSRPGPDRLRPPGPRSPRRTPGHDRGLLRGAPPGAAGSQRHLPRSAAGAALPHGAEWDALTAAHPTRSFTPFQTEGGDVVDLGARAGRTFAAERASDSAVLFEYVVAHAEKLIRDGKRVLFASWTDGSSDRLGSMLADHGLKSIRAVRAGPRSRAAEDDPAAGVLPLETGFETDDLAVIAETDILGDRLARPPQEEARRQLHREASSLSPGDLVVHIDHGIGRYEG
jgi:transcription-repair coupling factor (superfamily II helicase)